MGCAAAKKPVSKEGNATSVTVVPEKAPEVGRTRDEELTAPKASAHTVITTTQSTARVMPEAPVALLMQGKADKLPIDADVSVELEAPALYPRRKLSVDMRVEQEKARAEVMRVPTADKDLELPQVKSLANLKSSFNPDKFRKANQGALPSLANLPLSVQEQLDDIQILGGMETKAGDKPLSSLKLMKTQATSLFTGSGQPILVGPAEQKGYKATNLEQYVSGRLQAPS